MGRWYHSTLKLSKSNFFLYQCSLYSLLFVLCQLLSSILDKNMTLRLEVKHRLKYVHNLKCIDDELWCCHGDGITVYNFDLEILTKLSHPYGVKSVSSLDVKTIVIATEYGLSTCSKQGLWIKVVTSNRLILREISKKSKTFKQKLLDQSMLCK